MSTKTLRYTDGLLVCTWLPSAIRWRWEIRKRQTMRSGFSTLSGDLPSTVRKSAPAEEVIGKAREVIGRELRRWAEEAAR